MSWYSKEGGIWKATSYEQENDITLPRVLCKGYKYIIYIPRHKANIIIDTLDNNEVKSAVEGLGKAFEEF